MPLVTGVEPQARRRDRYNLFLDGAFAMGLHGDLVREAAVAVGRTLRPEDVRDLAGREAYLTALDTAYRFLAYRPRSEAEVRMRLRRAKVDDITTGVVLARLGKQRLLDDSSFARLWIESRQTHSPRSRRVVQWELRRKGVNQEIAEEAACDIDDEEAAYRAGAARARHSRETDYDAFRKRLGDFLVRRGFGYGIARRTVDCLWQERGEEKP